MDDRTVLTIIFLFVARVLDNMMLIADAECHFISKCF